MCNRRFLTQRKRFPVPQWEKDFCLEIGGMRWEDFLEAKKYAHETSRVMQWDDSEGRECFYNAKNRFRALRNRHAPNYHCNISLPSPDKYIDSIDWNNSEIDPQLLTESEMACKASVKIVEEENQVPDSSCMFSTEPVNPTGWDVCNDWQGPKTLSGMTVGDDGDDESCTTFEILDGEIVLMNSKIYK